MPTALRGGGFVFRVYGPPREHPPPHVHVERGTGELVILRLGTAHRPPAVWQVFRMRSRDVLRSVRLAEQHRAALEQAWRKIHG